MRTVPAGKTSGSGRLTQEVVIEIAAVSGYFVKLAINGQETEWLNKQFGDNLKLQVNFDLKGN